MIGDGAVGLGIEPLAGATCARGGAEMVEGTFVVFEGETGTELTCMTSSWKSIGSSIWFALSFLSTTGAGTEGFKPGDGLRAGLVCLGARGGGGNN